MNESGSEHLTPELFIDVVEKNPVDSRWRQHLATCRDCADELRGLEHTLGSVREPAAEPARPAVSHRLLALAAAALVVLGMGGYLFEALSPGSEGEVTESSILPPLGADEDFAVLLALSSSVPAESLVEAVEIGASPSTPLELESFELTPVERRLLLERLTTQTEERPGS